MSAVIESRDLALPDNVEFGSPQDWTSLIQPPTEQALAAVSDIVAMVDSQEQEDILERLSNEPLTSLAQLFSACPEIVFFFIAWVRSHYRVAQRAGADQAKSAVPVNITRSQTRQERSFPG